MHLERDEVFMVADRTLAATIASHPADVAAAAPAPLTSGTATSRAPSGLAAYRARIAAEKRAAILGAAVAIFLDVGYDRATLETIAARAEVSTGTLFKHFPTKAALFGAISARLGDAEHLPAVALPLPGDPRRGLRVLGEAYAATVVDATTIPLFRIAIAEAVRFPTLGEQLQARVRAPHLARLVRYLVAEHAAGTLALDEDGAATAASEFLAMLADQLFWPRLLVASLTVSGDDTSRVVARAVDMLLARYAVR